MSTLELARLMFAVTAGVHFLFVALTLGLAPLVAIMETRAVRSGNPVHERMTRFWGQLYVINYAVGIVTGLLMEFQFGWNWPGLMDRAQGVFGAPLALETLVAFFLESTFLGLWIFGWHRMNRYAHLALIWVVTLTAYLSAYFVLVANGFLKNPVGYALVGHELRIDDVGALLTNPDAILPVAHIAAGAFLLVGFVIAGVSGYHLRRARPRPGRPPAEVDVEFFTRSLRYGLASIALAITPSVIFGGMQFAYMKEHSGVPAWAETGGTFMMTAWLVMSVAAVAGAVRLPFRRWLVRGRFFHLFMIIMIPLPYLTVIAGWMFREGARQPWLVYGLVRTEDAVRPMSSAAMLGSLGAVCALFAVLVVVNATLLTRHARRGPDAASLGRPAPEPAAEPTPTF